MSTPGPTYAEVIASRPCPRCLAATGEPCADLSLTSDYRQIATPHRLRLLTDPLVATLIVARLQQGLSQRELTRRMGTSSASLSDWERGIHHPNLPSLHAWATALGLTITTRRTP